MNRFRPGRTLVPRVLPMTLPIVLLALLAGPAPAFAQLDFSGEWAPLYHENAPERGPGPELGDYTEFPLNEAGRLQAESWEAGRISVVEEYQCRPHGPDYGLRSLGNLRIERVLDPQTQQVVAFKTRMLAYDNERTIWLDGRPHPPDYAPHTWQGFSTGVWDGNVLTITTTHLKTNYMRRNGIPRSNQAWFTEHWMRYGDYLTIMTVLYDPVFLEEPLIRSEDWFLDPGQHIGVFGCEYQPEVPREEGAVPHYLPGENPHLREFAEWYGLPYEATRGGAETLYPEYRLRMGPYNPPEMCERYCTCTGLFNCSLR